jgi:hypothetical protein
MSDEPVVEKNLFSPLPTREAGQRSTNLTSAYLTRFIPAWQRPIGWNTNMWRAWVMNQPVAIICRETLIANLLSLSWKITPRDMSFKTELDATIKHYTKLFEQGGNNPELELDYSSLVEWIAADLLDTPFGGVAEVGRKGDAENGRVMWLKPLDAATMYPTLNKDFPAVQYYNGVDAIPFPQHAVARTYMTPRPFMDRQGWGMAVPEKVYFALEMLSRGDKYYANLLLDIPTAGILDLGDMEKSSAEEWVESFKAFMGDSEQAFRIPVLYEHNNPIQYIPFGKVPNDIMFDNITMKYAAIVASAYGMTLNDIGLTSNGSGGTLAGTIRSDIKYNKTGFARAKSKIKYFFNQILPPTLQFSFIDYDYEQNVAMGRARLASSTAFQTFATMKAFSPQEIRNQAIADGLFTITIPDELPPESEFPEPPMPTTGAFGKPAVTTGTQKKKVGKLTGSDKAGSPKPAAKGGEGEFNTRSLADDKVLIAVQKMVEAMPHVAQYLSDAGEDDRQIAKLTLKIEPAVLEYLSEVGNIVGDRDFADELFGETLSVLDEMMFDNPSEIVYDNMVETLMSRISHSYLKKEETDGN